MTLISELEVAATAKGGCKWPGLEQNRQLVQLMGRNEGLPAPLIYRKAWALLGYLAVESNRLHSRAMLAALFWPGLGETSALTNLRQVLSNLNRYCSQKFGPGVLCIERARVGLLRDAQPMFDIDLVRSAPCRLLRMQPEQRNFLDDMEGLGGVDFFGWLESTRQEMERQLVDATERCCDESLAAGEWAHAVVSARALVDHDPWSEAHARRLMRAYAGIGLPDSASYVYYRFEALLREELGIDTALETRELLAQINATGLLQSPLPEFAMSAIA
ncbi:AfsR/SARP family transcriptional regulator [Stenotrophomonas humi]